jgi:hypothetical protein
VTISFLLIMDKRPRQTDEQPPETPAGKTKPPAAGPREIGGPKGPEPTRYGDWEYNGRCTDF